MDRDKFSKKKKKTKRKVLRVKIILESRRKEEKSADSKYDGKCRDTREKK